MPSEPEAGFEPAAYALRVRCSTPELPRRGAMVTVSPRHHAWRHRDPASFPALSLLQRCLDEWDRLWVADAPSPGENVSFVIRAPGLAPCRHGWVCASAK